MSKFYLISEICYKINQFFAKCGKNLVILHHKNEYYG